MRYRSSTEEAVLACVHGSAPRARSAIDTVVRNGQLVEVLKLAQDHQVTGYVHRALGQIGTDRLAWSQLPAGLRTTAAQVAVHHLRAWADVHMVSTAFAIADVPWLVIKGPVLAERVYPAASLRPSRDIDVVVPADTLSTAIEALETRGAKLLDANWDLAIMDRRGQVHIRLPRGTTMDLHWHLVNSGRVRDRFAISMPSVWRDLRAVRIRDLHVDTLSVTDTVIHLGLHAALTGAWRLRWLNDLKLVVAHEPIDWASVRARAREWRVGRLVGVTLMRSSRLLGADVPDDVLVDLMGSRLFFRIARILDRIWGPVRTAGVLTPAQLWPQLMRDSWPDASRTVVRRIQRRAGNGFLGFWHGRERPEMMTPSGGIRGRERYLHLIERGELDETSTSRYAVTAKDRAVTASTASS